MTERERLSNLIYETLCVGYTKIAAEHIADYLLANGVIVPPCKVGNIIWINDFVRPCGYKVTGFSFGDLNDEYFYADENVVLDQVLVYYTNSNGSITGVFAANQIGKTVFLNYEEAEKALKEVQGNDR